MKKENTIALFWFRRDLRLNDNIGLNNALKNHHKVLPIFIFDTNILDELKSDDPRVSFIYKQLNGINEALHLHGSSLKCLFGNPTAVFNELIKQYQISHVYLNKDYEPYAIKRDKEVYQFLKSKGVNLHGFKDQVIFEKLEITKDDGTPYTVFTPYKKKWITNYLSLPKHITYPTNFENFLKCNFELPTLKEMNFIQSSIEVPTYNLNVIDNYKENRDYPFINGTSYLSTHLRFGTVSIREISAKLSPSSTFLSELIWREFFMQILYNFPSVVTSNFKAKYDGIKWRNNQKEFELWCNGKTGYPIVDAGMNQLNKTGLMHNRVRMITAGFLCKHLLIDWRWGEAYFASKLLDYDLSSNNGNWQWAAGTGCDAAPYFRIFNPSEQQKKFDPENKYINQWNTNLGDPITPIVEHKFARVRALNIYKDGLD
jgi:deoxyribodipyrimidine photo-lyase